MKRIVITGPESTGKTILSKELAKHYKGIFVPEYAREFIGSLHRKYSMADVIRIAKYQLKQMDEHQVDNGFIFYDTWLIITKIWLEVRFNATEEWIDHAIANTKIDYYLLCAPDIPWEPDPLRENGGHMREKLFHLYMQVLETHKLRYEIISGPGEERLSKAIFALNKT